MQKELRRQLGPLSASFKALTENSALRQITEQLRRRQETMRAALGPMEDLRRLGLLDPQTRLPDEFRQMREAMSAAQSIFRMPEVGEAARLLREYEASGVANAIRQYGEHAAELRRAMDAVRTPWLNIVDRLGSIGGFVELQNIGHALRTLPPFDTSLSDALRIDLGDWREEIEWPQAIFGDAVARSSFYSERGLDTALTAFPADAFQQSVTIAGLRGAPPPFVAAYNLEPETEDEEEAGLERTNAAHDRLQRFETQLRKFINERMTAAFGENWIKHQVPGEIRKAWLEKRQKANDNGEPDRPLIAYADFSDYVPIIVRKDNWEQVFEPVFRRPMFVQESFQRLYPIRICTMHARIITQDDELYLYVETKRILGAIG